MAKGSSSNRKEVTKEEILKCQEGRKYNEKSKNTTGFSYHLELSKLCLTIEAKTITISDVALNVCRDTKTIL